MPKPKLVKDDKPECDCGRGSYMYPDGTPSPCPDCQPTASKITTDAYMQKEKQQKVERLINSSGLAPRFKGLEFDGYETYGSHKAQMQKVLNACENYADDFEKNREEGKWLVMIGQCGTGKGHLAAAIANQVMRENQGSVLFRKYIELVSKIKETWHGRSDVTENKIIEVARECDLLILDEIGLQFETNAEKVILYRILDSRYENIKPVIMTTNLGENQLERVIGERALDRIYEPPNEILLLNWPSYRRRGAL